MKYVIHTIIVLIGVTGIALFSLSFNSGDSMVYINTTQVYDEFRLKKELEVKYMSVNESKKMVLDSLAMSIGNISNSIEAKPVYTKSDIQLVERMKLQYMKTKEQYEKESNALAQKYTDQVWNQLNQYIKDYGQKKQYQFIFGSKGDGNLMYAKDGSDITEDVVKYVNERYEGSL